MGGFNFGLSNILSEEEAAQYFDDTPAVQEETPANEVTEPQGAPEKPEEQENNTAEVTGSTEDFFDGEPIPESVGSGNNKDTEEDTSTKSGANSPNVISSVAAAFAEEGVFSSLSDEELGKINSSESLLEAMEKEIASRFEERQRRLDEALQVGVKPDVVKQYNGTMNFLKGITADQLSAETAEGEDLRRKLIQQSFMNKGYSDERAVRMTQRLFASGDDIEEAKVALQENLEYFQGEYDKIVNEAKAADKREKEDLKAQVDALHKDIMNNETVLGGIQLDKKTRQQVFDTVAKPIKDPKTGNVTTRLQKFRQEHESEFLKYVGLFMTLTDDFTNFDKLAKPFGKREVKSKMRELEKTLTNTLSGDGGKMTYMGGRHSAGFAEDFTIDMR